MVLVEFVNARKLPQQSSATTSMLRGRTFTTANVGGSEGALRLAAHIDDGQGHDSHAGLPLKAGSSYTGRLIHPSFPNEEFHIRVDLTSATDGVWREEDQAHHHEQQKFTVKYEGDLIKMLDKRDQIVGKMDAKGIIHCEITRDGVAGGSLVLKPANVAATRERAHAGDRGARLTPANATATREHATAGEHGFRLPFVVVVAIYVVPLCCFGGVALYYLTRSSIKA
eukprot:gnl/TRDRNA2_/TRDRNA2_131662_c0_seq2.p1 gnl/TRDRNA2_/TRDRNA2_131662_c0~~gnl/TRDRNA2_/TRDRNA2_131662_c0_seq2.p1  ORF type:complete len:245 (-),score=30.07 gnl/TRDRNA2_/TRDRNA2_131662_c0_seq2:89-766(-)